jgi:predicted RNase H-like HicB family nuclease
MLLEYVDKALSQADYDKLDDGTYSGRIPCCPGVIAFGETLYQCQQELQSVLEGWLIVKIRHGDKLPSIGGINLSPKKPVLNRELAVG